MLNKLFLEILKSLIFCHFYKIKSILRLPGFNEVFDSDSFFVLTGVRPVPELPEWDFDLNVFSTVFSGSAALLSFSPME